MCVIDFVKCFSSKLMGIPRKSFVCCSATKLKYPSDILKKNIGPKGVFSLNIKKSVALTWILWNIKNVFFYYFFSVVVDDDRNYKIFIEYIFKFTFQLILAQGKDIRSHLYLIFLALAMSGRYLFWTRYLIKRIPCNLIFF